MMISVYPSFVRVCDGDERDERLQRALQAQNPNIRICDADKRGDIANNGGKKKASRVYRKAFKIR